MSDEPKQPPLRLKPRKRPDDETAEPSPAQEKPEATPETSGETATETKPKLRLKPRLAVDPAEEKSSESESAPPAAEAPAEEPTEEAPQTIRLKPRLAAEPEPSKEEAPPTSHSETPIAPEPGAVKPPTEAPTEKPVATEKPKFRLKPRLAAEPEATSTKEAEASSDEAKKEEPPSPEPPAEAKVKSAPKFTLKKRDSESPQAETGAASTDAPPKITMDPPVSADETGVPSMPPPPLVQVTSSDDFDDDELLSDDEDEETPPPKKSGKKLVGLLVLIIVGAGGYFGWQYFRPTTPEPMPESPAAQKAPTPSATLNKIAALPGQLINKAQQAVQAREESGQADVEAALAQKETPPTPAEPEVVVQQVTAHSQSVIAPDVTATTSTVMSAVEAGPAFQNFVAQARINGVFQGSPSRALINGHTYREGEMVDPALGIYFDHVLPEEKLIVFSDDSGATVQRKY